MVTKSGSDLFINGEQEKSTGEYPVLIAQQGPLDGHRWVIKDSLLLGRDHDCDICIEDRQVSRHHARINLENGICKIEDLGSKNGTFSGTTQVDTPVQLQDGDNLQIAWIQKFTFYNSDATMPMEDLDPKRFLHTGRLVMDKKARRVWLGNKELVPPLSASQFRLLMGLYEKAGKVVSRDELIQNIWQDEDASGVSDQALDALIRRLRDRIAEIDPDQKYIVTVRGHGIRLDNA